MGWWFQKALSILTKQIALLPGRMLRWDLRMILTGRSGKPFSANIASPSLLAPLAPHRVEVYSEHRRETWWFWCEKIWRSHRPYWTSMRIVFFLSANFRPDLCSKDSGRVTALHGWQDCNWRSCVAGFDAVVAQTKKPVLLPSGELT